MFTSLGSVATIQKKKKKKKKVREKSRECHNHKLQPFPDTKRKTKQAQLFNFIAITKTCLFKYIEYFTTKKKEIFQIKNSYIFQISAQNIDCWYSLEPPRQGGSTEYSQFMF